LNDAFPYQNIAFNLHIVVRSGKVCRYLVVEALITSIYLVPEKKTFIYTRPTKLAARGHLGFVQLDLHLSCGDERAAATPARERKKRVRIRDQIHTNRSRICLRLTLLRS
jgi:hypothetical protein